MRIILCLVLIACAYRSLAVASIKSSQLGLATATRQNNDKKQRIATSHNRRKVKKDVKADVVDVISAKESTSLDLRGPSSILGGALAHLTLGTLYCWGNFLSYSPQNLKFFDGKQHPGSQPDSLYVIPLTLIFQAISMPFGPSIVKKIGARKTMLLGAWMTAAATYLASYQTNLASFMLFYSALFGTGVGLAYIPPMIAGWSYMPQARGLVSGGILAGFGAGGFFFSLIGSKIANPNGLNPVNGVFKPEVYENFPRMLRTLGMIYAVVSLIGALLVFEPKPATVPSGPTNPTADKSVKSVVSPPALPGLSILEAIKSKQFWLMWMMVVASATTGLNTAAIYKQYAATSSALTGDQYQAFVGGIGAIFNGSGRLFWGSLSDMIGFKRSFVLLTLLQMTSILTYMKAASSKALFAINTCSLFFCLAGNLALMPPVVQKVFGPKSGATIYGILYSSFAVASVVGGLLTKSLAKSLGWNGLFTVLAAMSFVATMLVQLLQPVSSYAGSSV
jgi:MFS transporter, OFA family, oxalate/formate antiporter